MRSDFRVWTPVAVAWGDMDAMGHVNNTRYFAYMESGRVEYFRALDLWRLFRPGAEGPAVVSLTCNFRSQLRWPAAIEVGTRTGEVRNRSFTLITEIYRSGTEDLVADGSCVTVWVDYTAGKALPLPEEIATALRQFDGVS